VDDGSSDGSSQFLVELVEAMGGHIEVESEPPTKRPRLEDPCVEKAKSPNHHNNKPVLTLSRTLPQAPHIPAKHPKWAELAARKEASSNETPREPETPIKEAPIAILSVEEVKAAVIGGNTLRVISVSHRGVPSSDLNPKPKPSRYPHEGQGAAMNVALNRARAPLIGRNILNPNPYWLPTPQIDFGTLNHSLTLGQMESDDERPSECFSTLKAALNDNPDWEGVCSHPSLIGWVS